MKRRPPPALPTDYGRLLTDIKGRVRAAQLRAGLAANRELLALYWDIGRMILTRQKAEGWGAKIIDRLSRDLQNEFPGQQGFSPRNLKYMRAFAEAWPETVIVQAPLAQSSESVAAIVQQPAAQIPWTHHCMLLDKLSFSEDRLWYAAKALENGWSRPILALQIESGLHTRQGKAVTNFKATLPPPQSDLAQQITKDPYVFDFLDLGLRHSAGRVLAEGASGICSQREGNRERACPCRRATPATEAPEIMTHSVKPFAPKNWRQFYFMYPQICGTLSREFVADLPARSEIGQTLNVVNLYLNWWKANAIEPGDNPPIGILVCSDRDRTEVEFATAGTDDQLFVSHYLTALPTAEQLQRFLEADRARIEALTDGSPSKSAPGSTKPTARPARKR